MVWFVDQETPAKEISSSLHFQDNQIMKHSSLASCKHLMETEEHKSNSKSLKKCLHGESKELSHTYMEKSGEGGWPPLLSLELHINPWRGNSLLLRKENFDL